MQNSDYQQMDAVALAAGIQAGDFSVAEIIERAIDVCEIVNPAINAVVCRAYAEARQMAETVEGPLAGVPSLLKDNTDWAGMPTLHGSRALPNKLAVADDAILQQMKAVGLVPLAKTRLPEFGFTATTEFSRAEPCRNPWNVEYSTGGSSGGSAALVAAGAVPIAHANDGGGSIRIPASCCGLVGLKPSRGRLLESPMTRKLPLNIVNEGVVTRSVRDTAAFYAAAEQFYRNKSLPAMGHVHADAGSGVRPLRIALVTELFDGTTADPECVAVVEQVAQACADLGHSIEPLADVTNAQMVDDFLLYWASLAASMRYFGKQLLDPQFDYRQLEPLTRQLARYTRKQWWRVPGAIRRLKQYSHEYAEYFKTYDVILSPTIAQPPKRLGELNPGIEFDEAYDRLTRYVAFTPAQNVSGAPGISLPLGQSTAGLPIGVHFAAAMGQEPLLLQLAYALEEAMPWPQLAVTT